MFWIITYKTFVAISFQVVFLVEQKYHLQATQDVSANHHTDSGRRELD